MVEAARYRLSDLDNPQAVDLYDDKVVFCFFDQVLFRASLPGTPELPQHSTHDCGARQAKQITMGSRLSGEIPTNGSCLARASTSRACLKAGSG